MKKLIYSFLIFIICIVIQMNTTVGFAAVRYVKSGGSGNGSSWVNASGDLQSVINSSAAGDSIWVASGIYFPSHVAGNGFSSGDKAFVLSTNVKIYGGFPALGSPGMADRNWANNRTILNGIADGGGIHHVVVFAGNTGTALLDGFTITGGQADGTGSIQVNGKTINRNSGGGIYIHDSSPRLLNLTITGNLAGRGGGIFNTNSSPALINVAIIGNSATEGGGVYNHHSNPILTNVTIAGNLVEGEIVTNTAIYVAPDGKDSNQGTKESPLATLAGARDKIRKIKAASGLPAGGITVYFRDGIYQVTETTEFSEEDSGTEGAPIKYTAYPGEKPVFNGGHYIKGSDFRVITDLAVLQRLGADAKTKVVSYNLFENGFTYDDLDYSKGFWAEGNLQEYVDPKYYDNAYLPRRMQVFTDDEAMHPARYPNKKEGQFADNPYDVYLSIPEVLSGKGEGNTDALIFRTEEGRIKKWKSFDDIIIFGMLGYQFTHDKVIAEKIDPQNMTITLKYPLSHGIGENMRYAFENVFEELDAPGEYYIDKHTGMLYMYPVKDLNQSTVKVSKLDKSYMISSKDASYVVFSGLAFELTKGSVMWIRGGRNCTVENCTFKNFGISGIRLGKEAIATRDMALEYQIGGRFQTYLNDFPASNNGFNHKITGSRFLNTGFAACNIFSGNAANRENGNMLFENNSIKHSGLLGSSYNSGLILNGAGITIKNNSFFYCRGQAINGNMVDTEIIYNEFCDSPCDMGEDTGTIYLNYVCNNDGVKIRYNWFHDVTNEDDRYTNWGFAIRAAVAYDNLLPFQDCSYNVISNVPIGVYTPRVLSPNTCINNVFIDCNVPTSYDDWWFRETYENKSPADMLAGSDGQPSWKFYSLGIYKDDVWKDKYPDLYKFFNYMANEKEDLFEPMDQYYNNIMVNTKVPMLPEENRYKLSGEVDPEYGKFSNNRWLESDPGFANYTGKNFQLPQGVCNQLGVERLNMSLIGVKTTGTENGEENHYRSGEGAGMYNVSSAPQVYNSIVWSDHSSNVYNTDAVPAYSYSLIYGINPGGVGNLNGIGLGNHIFTDASNNDYSLLKEAPAINAGSNQKYLDALEISGFMGEKDLAGSSRLFDSIIDLGAYELQSSSTGMLEIHKDVVVWSHQNRLFIRSERSGSAKIYSIGGQLKKQVNLVEGIISEPLEYGVYIVVLDSGMTHKVIIQ